MIIPAQVDSQPIPMLPELLNLLLNPQADCGAGGSSLFSERPCPETYGARFSPSAHSLTSFPPSLIPCSMQVSLGLPDPRHQSSLPMLKRVQAGIQRVRPLVVPASSTRLPTSASVMERIRGQLESSSNPHKELLWAVACTAYFWLLPPGGAMSRNSEPG